MFRPATSYRVFLAFLTVLAVQTTVATPTLAALDLSDPTTLTVDSLIETIIRLINIFTMVLPGVVAVLMLMLSGFYYMLGNMPFGKDTWTSGGGSSEGTKEVWNKKDKKFEKVPVKIPIPKTTSTYLQKASNTFYYAVVGFIIILIARSIVVLAFKTFGLEVNLFF